MAKPTTSWDETTPSGSEGKNQGDNRIREVKTQVREVVGDEHTFPSAGQSDEAGNHKKGSARAYYESADPTTRPDGSTSLDSNDDGRLMIDSDNSTLRVYSGSGWEDVKVADIAERTPGTIEASKVLIVDGDKNLQQMGDLTFEASKGIILNSSAQGDVYYFDGSRMVRLPAGVNGQYLQTQGSGSNPTWSNHPQDLVLIETKTASSSPNIEFSGFIDDSLYLNYKVTISNLEIANGENFLFEESVDGGSNYGVGTRSSSATGLGNGGTTISFTSSDYTLFEDYRYNSVQKAFISLDLVEPTSSQTQIIIFNSCYINNVSNERVSLSGCGDSGSAKITNAIRFKASTGSIATGNFSIYGIKK